MSAPNDETFLGIVENIFLTVMEIEQVYLKIIEESHQTFVEHNEKMKIALAKSSSGDSELNSMNEAEDLYNRSHQEDERQDSSEGSR